MRSSEKYRVMLIEPSIVIVEGLKVLLGSQSEFKIEVVVNDFQQAIIRLQAINPDVVIINPKTIELSGRSSIKSLSPILQTKATVALVYDFFDIEVLRQFDEVIGINDLSQIVKKLRSAVENKLRTNDEYEEPNDNLSDREKEILISVASGMTNKQIASQHNISVYTVISHRKNISRKTEIKSVSGLTVYAMLNGLIDV